METTTIRRVTFMDGYTYRPRPDAKPTNNKPKKEGEEEG